MPYNLQVMGFSRYLVTKLMTGPYHIETRAKQINGLVSI